MTAVMAALHRALPPEDRHPLPPRHITERMTQQAGVDDNLSEPEKQGLTAAAHFGYGAATGVAYGLLRPSLPLPGAVAGVAYGLAVWAGSYMGLLPKLRLYPHAEDESAERNALMIAAHVVWGAALGVVTDLLSDPRRDTP
jgi:putative membrane protein